VNDADTIGAYAEALTRLFGLTEQDDAASDAVRRTASDNRVEPFVRPGQRKPR